MGIETDRTIMRPWRSDDLEGAAAWMNDAEVMHCVRGVANRAGAWRAIATDLGCWQLRGDGLWRVQRKSDGALLGRIGLWNPEARSGIEVGWTLAGHAWGGGLPPGAGRPRSHEPGRTCRSWTGPRSRSGRGGS